VNAAANEHKVGHWTGAESVGLPSGIRACLFDLDGVLTKTARLHAAAWKATFDHFLLARSVQRQEPYVAFDSALDYDLYVDGRAREDGIREFFASRGIEVEAATVATLGERKNDLVHDLIRSQGLEPYEGSVRYLRAVVRAGLRRAVVSASANCRAVLEAAGIADLFEERVDGVVAEEEHLRGKPAPDMFLAAADRLGVPASEGAVFEDALAGVAAGRAGAFALVVGVDRDDQPDALRAHGADVVVTDLADLL